MATKFHMETTAFACERTGAGGSPPGASGAALPGPSSESAPPTPGRLERWWRESTWAPVVARAAGAIGLLGGLGLFGASSVSRAGVPVALPARGSSWVASPAVHGSAVPDASVPGHAAPAPGASAALTPEPRARRGRRPCGEAEVATSPGVLPDGRVVLNLATPEDLQRLPGVGARRAGEIVALRTRLKRFRRPTDLLRVRGIGVRALQRMQPHLVVDSPEPSVPAASAVPPAAQPPLPASHPDR